MKKLIAIIFAISLIAPSPAQANEKIIDKMVQKYMSIQNSGCATNIDNLLLEMFKWTGGDSNYQDCPELVYGDPLSWATPLVAFTPNDYSIWLKKCDSHFFSYMCPQDKTSFNFNVVASMTNAYYRYLEAQKNTESIAIFYSKSMQSWNNIYKEYYPSKNHNCKPLKPFYYTSRTGSYIVSAKQIDKNTYVVKAGPEYKTYKYTYTKKEQKEHMDSCISDWKKDNEWQTKMYNQYKDIYLDNFNLSEYAPGKPCNVAKKIVEFKDIATVKCSNNVWVKVK